jgi:transcriptional regulator with XRE-family HTH domain
MSRKIFFQYGHFFFPIRYNRIQGGIRVMDSTELEELLGKRIAQLRTTKGVSAREMSLSIGQGQAYINNIENGKVLPSLRGLQYICEYLNISLKDFFDFDSAAPGRLNDIIKDLKALSLEQLSNVAGIVRGLKR